MAYSSDFTEGKITGPLIRFAVPIFFALFLQAMYGAVDLLIVGQFGTAADVSAVSTGGQIMQTVTGVVAGLTMGTTILIGQRIGEKRVDRAANTIGASICLLVVLAVVLTVALMFTARPFTLLMNTPPEAVEKTISYVLVCSGGAICIIAYNMVGSVFRGIGDSKTPFIVVAIACGVNVLGDLLLIGVLGMATVGAAIATVFAQAVSVIVSLLIVRRHGLPFPFSRANIRFDKKIIRHVVVLGTPLAMQDLLVNISFLVVYAIVNSLGLIPSAGVGVAIRLSFLIMLVPITFMQALAAFVAHNIGANKRDRAKRALRNGVLISLCIGALIGCFTLFKGDTLAGIFSNDPAVIAAAYEYLKAFVIDCLLTPFFFCFLGFFNGCGKTRFVMVQGLVAAFCIRIPFVYFVSQIPDVSLFFIGLATPAASFVQSTLCIAYLFWLEHRARREETLPDSGEDKRVQGQETSDTTM